MNYRIRYSCLSHAGKSRRLNQDNFICDGQYMDDASDPVRFPLQGSVDPGLPGVFGVFDGLGGEQCGETASLIAARTAAGVRIGSQPLSDLTAYCMDANRRICACAEENDIGSMGTTAALLTFSGDKAYLMNIGDTKVFRFAHRMLKQVSMDHYSVGAYGRKPPLLQYLGIPENEMIIEPYTAQGCCHAGDTFLICSDGLTDMVPLEEISSIMDGTAFEETAKRLLDRALEKGGKDNITILLCRAEDEESDYDG